MQSYYRKNSKIRSWSLILGLLILFRGNAIGQTGISGIRFGSTGNPLNGLTIAWTNPGNSDSIKWGYTSDFENGKFETVKSNSITGNQFEYTFPTLKSGSTIFYKLFDSKQKVWTEQLKFQTASDASENQFSFTVLGDSRTNVDEWKIISEATLETDFTLFLGDIINSGNKSEEWHDWFQFGKKYISGEPIYHCVGNHDRDNSIGRFDNFLGLFTLPGNELYYSFNYGNVVFICLNSENAKDKTQYKWLLSTLEANKDKTWKIIFFHRPFFTSPDHSGEMDAYFDNWWKAFDDYGVDMIFNGHTHNYQRTKPINRNISTTSPVRSYGNTKNTGRCQIVAGNAGAPLSNPASADLWWLENSVSVRHFCNITIDNDKLIMKAMDANHIVFDSLILDKCKSEITFQVDLRQITDLFDKPEVLVNFKSGNISYKMSDNDGDNIYTFKLPPVPIGTELQYIFSYQDGPDPKTDKVEEIVTSECCNPDGYRFLKVPYGSYSLPRVVFGGCEEALQNINFQVDLREVKDLYEGGSVWVGSDSWSEPHFMTDSDNDGIYDYKMSLAPGTGLEYYFAYQNGVDLKSEYVKESGTDGRCFNEGTRSLWIGYEDICLPPVLFNKCDEALPSGFDITDLPGVIIKGSNDNESWESGAGSPDHERIEKLIDNDITTKYLVKAAKSWIEINTNRLSLLSAYTITSGNDAPERDPKDWELQAWDPKIKNWVTLHTVNDNPMWKKRLKRRSWYFENDKWFKRYRINITAINNSKDVIMQMDELHLFGKLKDYTD